MTIKRVGIYCRVSTLDQSTELQHRELEAYAKARGWLIEKIYEEKATGTNDRRPLFQACLKDAQERRIDVLMVWKLDRFARSLKDLLTHLQLLQEVGVEFFSLKDGIDMTTASGRLMTQMIGAFAEFEANMIRMRVKSGIENAKRRGKRLGRPQRIDSAKVEHLRRQGWSLSQIAKEVKATKGAVSKILSRMELNKGVKKPESLEPL